MCVQITERDINQWCDRVRQRAQLAQPEIFDGSEAGLQVMRSCNISRL